MTDTESLLIPAGLSLEHLQAIAESFESGIGYESYEVLKRRGGTRTIVRATVEVSSQLKLLRHVLDESGIYVAPPCVHGFVKGRSIVTNASQHLDRDVVLGLDLKGFFPSISAAMVERALLAAGIDEKGAEAISRATTVRGSIPAGLSTSPGLSNLVFGPTDSDLEKAAARAGVVYSRYADDLMFSGSFGNELLAEVQVVLDEHGWILNSHKTRFMKRGGPQYVTGLYVGDAHGPRVPRLRKRRLRQELYLWRQFGYDNIKDPFDDPILYYKHLEGWIRYVRMVEPKAAVSLSRFLDGVDDPSDDDSDDWADLLVEMGMG